MDSKNQQSDKELSRKAVSSLTISVEDDDNGKGCNTIHRSETLSTTATFESQASFPPSATPRSQGTTEDGGGSGAFETPEHKKINWEDKNISPTMLISHDEAISALESDGTNLEDFFIAASPRVKACIQYVYGLGIYCNLNPADRVQKISKLVETPGSRERLASMVFALPKNNMITNEKRSAYLQMAITSYLFSHHEKLPSHGDKRSRQVNTLPQPAKNNVTVFGGFPNKAIMLTQKGRNCFHPTTVLWISLTEQVYKRQDTILDAAQVARRYLMNNPDQLEKRVMENKGFSTVEFAQMISNKTGAKDDWAPVQCSEEDTGHIYTTAGELGAALITHMKEGKFGLITGFMVEPSFKEAARLHTQKQSDYALGFFMFDVDAETGKTTREWVSYENYKHNKKFRQPLKDLRREILDDLNKQNKKQEELKEKLSAELESAFPTEGGNDLNISDAENGVSNEASPPTPQSSGRHAMTIISCRIEKSMAPKFLVCNPWLEMPIVGVSAAYLRERKATVHFCSWKGLAPDKNLTWTNDLVADCVSYEVEGDGDGSDFPKDWLRDAFGYTSVVDSPRDQIDVFELLYNGGLDASESGAATEDSE
mmetsp:Transcript_2868/g.6110  ORF Transcript_2868/g.6110 Transcript_2868/m.6110 type:complete len:597 (-) Transcript_2868:335-2125(-)